jgi:hypothetical protein
VTWIFGFAEIGIVGVFSPFVVRAVIYPASKVSATAYLQSTRGPLWQLGACFLVDPQALVVWLIDMLVLPLELPLAFLA